MYDTLFQLNPRSPSANSGNDPHASHPTDAWMGVPFFDLRLMITIWHFENFPAYNEIYLSM
jgi:hypothetical protein